MDDLNNLDLSDFFSTVSVGRKKRKLEVDEVVGDAVNDFFSTISEGKKKVKEETKKRKIQEEKTVKAFEQWLYSDTPKKEDQVIEEVIEESLEEVLEVLGDYEEELKESTLIENH